MFKLKIKLKLSACRIISQETKKKTVKIQSVEKTNEIINALRRLSKYCYELNIRETSKKSTSNFSFFSRFLPIMRHIISCILLSLFRN